MTRKTLIAIALFAVLLAAVGVGIVAAASPPKLPPPYRAVQFDVIDNGTVVGKISVNTNQWTYILNAHGLRPATKYYLSCSVVGTLGSATTEESGELHMKGDWDPLRPDITEGPAPTCYVSPQPVATGTIGWADISGKWYTAYLWTIVFGYLTANGEPLPGQKIVISYYDHAEWHWWGSDTTDSSGKYSVTKAFTRLDYYFKARYDGGYYNDIYYDAIYCIPWKYSETV
jgi:hypothetical protein